MANRLNKQLKINCFEILYNYWYNGCKGPRRYLNALHHPGFHQASLLLADFHVLHSCQVLKPGFLQLLCHYSTFNVFVLDFLQYHVLSRVQRMLFFLPCWSILQKIIPCDVFVGNRRSGPVNVSRQDRHSAVRETTVDMEENSLWHSVYGGQLGCDGCSFSTTVRTNIVHRGLSQLRLSLLSVRLHNNRVWGTRQHCRNIQALRNS